MIREDGCDCGATKMQMHSDMCTVTPIFASVVKLIGLPGWWDTWAGGWMYNQLT
jgi:hypothetical protein